MVIETIKDFQPIILAVSAAIIYLVKIKIDNINYAKNYRDKVITDKKIESYAVLCESTSMLKSAAYTYLAEIQQPKYMAGFESKARVAKAVNDFKDVLHSKLSFIDLEIYNDLFDFAEMISRDIQELAFFIDIKDVELKFISINSKISKALTK